MKTPYDKAKRAVDRLTEIAAVTLMTLMVILTFTNVVSRYVFRYSITWSEEIARYLFVWASLVGCCVALRKKAHISIDFVVSRLKGGWLFGAQTLTDLLLAFFLVVFIYGGIRVMGVAKFMVAPASGIPFHYIVSILPISGALMLIEVLYGTAVRAKDRAGADRRQAVHH